MTISDDLNSIRTHLEDDYTALETLGVSVEDRNIENIKDMANQIYAKFPKTSYAEGSNITLSNTLKGKLDFENGIVGYGDTSQKSYEGYNLLQAKMNTTTSNGITVTNNRDGSFTINGTNTSSSITTFRLDQTTQTGIDNLQNYEDGTYTLDKGTTDTNIQITLMQNSTWTQYMGTGLDNKLVSRSITGATNTFIYIGIKGNATLNNLIIKPMFVKGNYTTSTIPDFEPYVGNSPSPNPSYPQDIEVVRGTQTVYIKDENNNIIDTKTINLGEYEFAKIGNYVDTIEYDVDEDKVYKNEVIGNKTFIGSNDENWSSQQYGTNSYSIGIADIKQSTDETTPALCLSNLFRGVAFGERVVAGNNIMYAEVGTNTLYIRNTSYNSLSGFKTMLSTNNLKVCYVKVTPTKIPITGTLKDQIKALYNSHSFTGTTIIEINGNLPLIIKVRANTSEGATPTGTISITSNGSHDVTNYATASVNVTPSTETKTVKSTTTSQTVNPTSGKLISQITVQPIVLDTVIVTPSTTSQTITPTNDGISQVNVSAVTSSIDNNITAGNIKKDVSILGVTGTYEGSGGTKPLVPDNTKFANSIVTSFDNFFQNLDFSDVVHYSNMFTGCNVVTSIDLSNFNKNISYSISNMFSSCAALIDIDLSEFNMSNLLIGSTGNSISSVFSGCNNLSNNSLNSILKMCSTHTRSSDGKTLKKLGLSQSQANVCQTLSNWTAFTNAGWTTGY